MKSWEGNATYEVYAQGSAFYVALVKSGYGAEATEFAEWFLETFDIDLET